MALILTTAEATALASLDTVLETALSQGTQDSTHIRDLNAMERYSDLKHAIPPHAGTSEGGDATLSIKKTFELVIASIFKTINNPDISWIVLGETNQYGTDSSSTPGSVTINKSVGISSIRSGTTSCTITNTLATNTSWISISWLDRLGTQSQIPWVTRASGSFTVNVGSAPLGDIQFAWEIKKII